MVYSWENKVVIITGAATGIGALVTRNLMEEGVKHVAVLDINEKAGLELQSELNTKYGNNKVKFYNVDVTNDDQFLGSFDAVVAEQGYLDVLINNAAIMNDGMDIYKKQIEINVTALVTGTLKAMEIMGKDKGGKGGAVINISSVVGLSQTPMFPIYFSTKSAVLQFSNCIGLDEYYSVTGVRVIAICFGATDTPLLYSNNIGHFSEAMRNAYEEQINMYPLQKIDNAAISVVEVFKQGKSGSTWISTSNKPVKDITAKVKKAYDVFSEDVYD